MKILIIRILKASKAGLWGTGKVWHGYVRRVFPVETPPMFSSNAMVSFPLLEAGALHRVSHEPISLDVLVSSQVGSEATSHGKGYKR